jgi:putative transposase
MNKAHVIKLYPNNKQKSFFVRSSGVARFSYNWALEKWKEMYLAGETPSAYTLIKLLTSIKSTQFPWMRDVGKSAPQYAVHNLESAFKRMWKINSGYPNFKKKGVKDSFVSSENTQTFKQRDKKIWVPRLGWVRCSEDLRFNGKVNNVVIKRISDCWFAVVNVEVENSPQFISGDLLDKQVVGVDLGIKEMAVISTGEIFKNPKALRSKIKQLKRQQRVLSRKEKGSSNRKKQVKRVAKIHYKVSCLRKNAIHNATAYIVKKAGIIVLENLNVSGMLKNHKLAQAISDVSFHELKRQIEYKANWAGKEIIFADRFYASSKLCSSCGWKNEKLTLKDRVFECLICGNSIDRDLNAAKNLAKYGSTVKFSGSNASEVGKISQVLAVADGEGGIK